MSTSKMQKRTYNFIAENLGRFKILENHRPNWLKYEGFNLELDIFIPELSVAIEVQGEQHYRFVKHFHNTYSGFKRQQARDQFKRDKCAAEGVALFEIGDTLDFDFATDEIIKIASGFSAATKTIDKLIKFNKHRNALKETTTKISKIMVAIAKSENETEKRGLDLQLQIYQDKLVEIFSVCPDGVRDALRKKSNNVIENAANIATSHIAGRRKSCTHLKIHKVSKNMWVVWGGCKTRTVERVDGKLVCDCEGAAYAKPMCVHCKAVTRHLRGDERIKIIKSISDYGGYGYD